MALMATWRGQCQRLMDIAEAEMCSLPRLRRHWVRAGRPDVLTEEIIKNAKSSPVSLSVTLDGESMTVKQVMLQCNVSLTTVYAKINKYGDSLLSSHFEKQVSRKQLKKRVNPYVDKKADYSSGILLNQTQKQRELSALSKIPGPSKWELENIGMR